MSYSVLSDLIRLWRLMKFLVLYCDNQFFAVHFDKAFTNAQLDALSAFYGVGPAVGVKLAKQRLLRPIIGDYRTDQ